MQWDLIKAEQIMISLILEGRSIHPSNQKIVQ
uniref:Uncharacterized protein n=1 Tax=Arundo donax TaxID=35708 RepID=A0A0A9FW56_ARUDO